MPPQGDGVHHAMLGIARPDHLDLAGQSGFRRSRASAGNRHVVPAPPGGARRWPAPAGRPTAKEIDPSDLNSATISVGDLVGHQTINRTVTNIGGTTGVYSATLQTPPGYKATVSPNRLVVPAGRTASYRFTFTRTSAAFGDKHHKVRSAITLRAAPIHAPDEVTGKDTTGSVTLIPRTGYQGTLATTVNGLYAGTTRTGTLTGEDPDWSASPLPPSAAELKVTVPEGTALARLAIQSPDFLPGSDIGFVAFDADDNLLSHPDEGSDEHVDLPGPGTYDVYVGQYALPPGADTKPDHPATVTPAKQRVSLGATVPPWTVDGRRGDPPPTPPHLRRAP